MKSGPKGASPDVRLQVVQTNSVWLKTAGLPMDWRRNLRPKLAIFKLFL